MSGRVSGKFAKKEAYASKVQRLCDEFSKILIVEANNVGSLQMQKIRISLRGSAVILMGKNTMIRRALRKHLEKNPKLEVLLPQLKFNVGLVFTNGDLLEIKKKILSNIVMAPARVGAIAPCDVIVPAGPTGMEPTMTSFLQVMNIASKINKGQVEITKDVELLKEGQKVGSSESALLEKLNIKPFAYGLKLKMVYDDGFLYKPSVIDMTDEDLISKFQFGVNILNSICLEIGYPTVSSIPHSILNAFKTLLAVSLETSYTFPEAEKIKQILENPDAFVAATSSSSGGETATAKPTETVAEPVEEDVEDTLEGGIDIFGGGGDEDW